MRTEKQKKFGRALPVRIGCSEITFQNSICPCASRRSVGDSVNSGKAFGRDILKRAEKESSRRMIMRNNQRAFTIVELLVIMGIIALLVSMMVPSVMKGKEQAKQTACINNLKQIGLAFTTFSHEHEHRPPTGVSISDGGVMEYYFGPTAPANLEWRDQLRVFTAISNELVLPKILACPAEAKLRPATSFMEMQWANVSYWPCISMEEQLSDPSLFWAADGITKGTFEAWQRGAQRTSDHVKNIEISIPHGSDHATVVYRDGHVASLIETDKEWFAKMFH